MALLYIDNKDETKFISELVLFFVCILSQPLKVFCALWGGGGGGGG